MERVSDHYCIDSDVLIDYLRGVEDAREFLTKASKVKLLLISVVSVVEIFSGKETRDIEKRDRIENFLENFEIIELDARIAKYAGELRREHQKPFADMIIAATAIISGIVLVTRNVKHFQGIKNLEVHRPY